MVWYMIKGLLGLLLTSCYSKFLLLSRKTATPLLCSLCDFLTDPCLYSVSWTVLYQISHISFFKKAPSLSNTLLTDILMSLQLLPTMQYSAGFLCAES